MSLKHFHSDSSRSQGIYFLLITMLMWGFQPLGLKIILDHFSVAFTAFLRVLVAAVIFGALALAEKRRRPRNRAGLAPATVKDTLWIAGGGIGLALSVILWNASLMRTTIGASSILQLNSTGFIALYGIIVLSERCGYIRGTGLVLALMGIFFIAWNGQDLSALTSSRYFTGNLLALGTGLGSGVCAIAQKVVVRSRSGLAVVAPIYASTALICGVFALLPGPRLLTPFHFTAFILICITGLFGIGVGNLLYTQAMRVLPVTVGAAAITAAQMISLVAAWALLHEPVTVYLIFGAPLTCIGVVMAMLSVPINHRGRMATLQSQAEGKERPVAQTRQSFDE